MSHRSDRIMNKVNEMAKLIRKEKMLSYGEFCRLFHMAPSTGYGYIRLLTMNFHDIEYFEGELRIRAGGEAD